MKLSAMADLNLKIKPVFRLLFGGALMLTLLFGNLGFLSPAQSANNPSLSNQTDEKLGYQLYQSGKYQEAIDYWAAKITEFQALGDNFRLATALIEQAQSYLAIGQPNPAIARLCNPRFPLDNLEEKPKVEVAQIIDNCQIPSAIAIAQTYPLLQLPTQGALAEAYRINGNYELVSPLIDHALATSAPSFSDQVNLLQTRANNNFSRGKYTQNRLKAAKSLVDNTEEFNNLQQQKHRFYQSSLDDWERILELMASRAETMALSPHFHLLKLQSYLNLIVIYQDPTVDQFNPQQGQKLLTTLSQWIEGDQTVAPSIHNLPRQPSTVYFAIDLANQIIGDHRCPGSREMGQGTKLLQDSMALAETINDPRSKSFALGTLGHLYEQCGQYDQALKLTNQAQWAAQQSGDSLYLWQWQAGRIYQYLGKRQEAIASYEQADGLLAQIRGDIITSHKNIQFDFRDTIEPFYRQLAQLKLEQATGQTMEISRSKSQGKLSAMAPRQPQRAQVLDPIALKDAMKAIDTLQLAELQNYFGDDCDLNISKPEEVTNLVDETTAIFNSIMVQDPEGQTTQTAIILTTIKDNQEHQEVSLIPSSVGLEGKIQQFQDAVRNRRDYGFVEGRTLAKDLYDQIIRPFSPELEPIKTLVFIQDGLWRNMPPGAFYDRDQGQYLIEQHAIATTPSLTVTVTTAAPSKAKPNALILGLSKRVNVNGIKFEPLQNVEQELGGVKSQFPNTYQEYLNNISKDTLHQELNQTPYDVVHIATHGEFRAVEKDSFLAVGRTQKLPWVNFERDLTHLHLRRSR
ncbi:MAG: CHAT domain-containing protein [Synechococcaceae cyanobacterium RL_1_2]|nr:CHAT domain-containing protein [Synechococcaceae cyanobacterium RL_1_2]